MPQRPDFSFANFEFKLELKHHSLLTDCLRMEELSQIVEYVCHNYGISVFTGDQYETYNVKYDMGNVQERF